MSQQSVISELHQMYLDASTELFRSLGCDIELVLEPSYEIRDVPVARIDAGSNDLELMLSLAVPLPVLSLSYPGSHILEVSDALLESWIPELSNQLMGKLKNKLILRGHELHMGLPVSLFGREMAEILPEGYEHATFYFRLDGELFETCISIQLMDPNFALSTEIMVDDSHVDDGELELF